MKLTQLRFLRKGTKLSVLGTVFDKFKKPANLKITLEPVEDAQSSEECVIMTGDAGTVGKTLAALAEAAWANGWRPMGLEAALATTIKQHGRKLTR